MSAFVSRSAFPGTKARETDSSYCKTWKKRVESVASSRLSEGLDHPIHKPRHRWCCVAFETRLPGEELLQHQESQPGWEMSRCQTAQPWEGTNHQPSACSRPHTNHAASPRGAAQTPAVPDTSGQTYPSSTAGSGGSVGNPGVCRMGSQCRGGWRSTPRHKPAPKDSAGQELYGKTWRL